jgi:hypothetical protein
MWAPDKLGDAIAALNQCDAFEPLVSIGMPIHNGAATMDAAMGWTARIGANALILFAMAKRFFPCSALVSGWTTLMLVVVLFRLM